MGKNKLKQKSKDVIDTISNQKTLDTLGSTTKQVASTLATVLIGEIVTIAIDRLIYKVSDIQAVKETNEPASKIDNKEINKPLEESAESIQETTLSLRNSIEETSPLLQYLIAAMRESISDITPTLAEVVDSLKAQPGRSLQQAMVAIGDSSEINAETVASSLRNTIATFIATDSFASSHQAKSIKSKGKKKKKKKKSK